MQETQAFINKLSQNITPVEITRHAFDFATANTLSDCLKNDAANYLYSSAVSIADAINGLRRGLVSWATVKLYYSTFYSCKGILALHNIGVIYIGTKPYVVEAISGKIISKSSGTTHKIVLSEFKSRNFEHSLLSQDISLVQPLDWLIEKRESANYKNSRFSEPITPDHFKKILDIGLRKSINAYVVDPDTYAFDPDHAILAYPIKTLKIAYSLLEKEGKSWSNDEKKYISSLFKDESGPITEIYKMFQ